VATHQFNTNWASFRHVEPNTGSYKSSKEMAGTRDQRPSGDLRGPGRKRGYRRIGTARRWIFKMEAITTTSYIETLPGPRLGVGGILRMSSTMGARPIAA